MVNAPAGRPVPRLRRAHRLRRHQVQADPEDASIDAGLPACRSPARGHHRLGVHRRWELSRASTTPAGR
ncbi:MAG: hypothetical protein R3F43_17820 [bacterium]